MMKPSIRIHSITFGLATTVVFSIWTQMSTIVGDQVGLLKVVMGALISLGIYRMIAALIVYLTKKSSFLKRQFLGPYYMEGTWVGFYINSEGKERYLIERFEQEIDTLVIRGKSFNEILAFNATWTATSVNIDAENGKISYMYECLPLHHAANQSGLAVFNFERSDQYSPPNGLRGFSADLEYGKKIKALEIKISNNCGITEDDALKEAKKIFEARKGSF